MQGVSNLTFPLSWQTLSTNSAGTNGLFEFTDLGATNAESYYRSATPTNPPDYRLFDAELLRLDIFGGGLPPAMRIRESPTFKSLGITRIRRDPDGSFTICSFFDVFTELSTDGGMTWRAATNGSILLILEGGIRPNGFPADTLPPPAGQVHHPAGLPGNLSTASWPDHHPGHHPARVHDDFPAAAPGNERDLYFWRAGRPFCVLGRRANVCAFHRFCPGPDADHGPLERAVIKPGVDYTIPPAVH